MARGIKSLRVFAKTNLYGKKIIKIFKNLKLLSERHGKMYIDDILEMTEKMLLVTPDKERIAAERKSLGNALSKNQYVAIVGVLRIPQETCFQLAKAEGLSKSNIKIFNDVAAFKSGKYTAALQSANCVAIIFGAIPHSHRESVEKDLADKVVLAKSKSSVHGKLKLTANSLKVAFAEVHEKINSS